MRRVTFLTKTIFKKSRTRWLPHKQKLRTKSKDNFSAIEIQEVSFYSISMLSAMLKTRVR